ncbi:MAG: DUF58 domain-containing protein [Acidimicrobiales bacterium]
MNDAAGSGSGSTSGVALVPAAVLARLERYALHTTRRLSGLYPASHGSVRYGSSVDFADYREYHPGDDFRRIDYHLYARLGVLALKLFEAEDDITVRLVLDTSASMSPDKLRQAARAAACIGWIALCRRDAVTLQRFADGMGSTLRFRGQGAAPALFGELADLRSGGSTRFGSAARELLSRPGPRGFTVVVSDLMTSEWMDGLDVLPSRGGEVLVVHVLDPEELDPQLFGDLDLVDAETGRVVPVSLTADVQRSYREAAQAWLAEAEGRCRHLGATYLRVLSDEEIGDAIIGAGVGQGLLR